MNEFIVWDKEVEKFYSEFSIDNGDFSCFIYDDYGCCDYFEDYSIHEYIGKTDINNKKIYADCSIVECKWVRKWFKCYFTFNDANLKYEIKLWDENSSSFCNVDYIDGITKIGKVVDTIQENKLGLIK